MAKVEINLLAPDFSLNDFRGQDFLLSDLRGKEIGLIVFNRGFF
jgi:peroxiredoxin